MSWWSIISDYTLGLTFHRKLFMSWLPIISDYTLGATFHVHCTVYTVHRKLFMSWLHIISDYTLGATFHIQKCTKIWRFHQKITDPSQKLGLTIRRKHANF